MKKTFLLLTCMANIFAIHAIDSYTLTLYAEGCETPNVFIYPSGQPVLIAPEAMYGYHFTQWSDGNTDNPRTITLTRDMTFTAQFAKNIYSFAVQTADPIMGSVTGTNGNYEHGTSLTLSATATYGYHFTQWSDGNTQNPRTLTLTKDTTLIAYFAKNSYTVNVPNSQYGSVNGTGKYAYLDVCTLTVVPEFGYHFTQWSDGNTDNPRSLVITQDTTLMAQFEQKSTIVGQCGEDLVWTFHNGILTITGTGAMYDSGYDSWSRWAEQITTINLPEGLTTIGNYAFSQCSNVKTITIPTTVTTIGSYAFKDCSGLRSITCYAVNPPTASESTFSGVSQYTKTYVLASSLEEYQFAFGWRNLNLLPVGGTETPVAKDEVAVSTSATEATLTWPANDQAAGYSIEITKDGVVFCTLKFNANGQLTGIAFAPSREGERTMPAAEMTAKGWQFTVTGLNEGTRYDYTVDVLDGSQQSIKHYTGAFTTTGATGWEDILCPTTARKLIYQNQLLIYQNDRWYNAQGSPMK